MANKTRKDITKWFDPRNRSTGTWAFTLNRITAIGLTVYLFLHLVILGNLARGAEAYDSFLEIIKQPWFVAAELLVVAGGIIHGLNGIRLVLNSFGIAVPFQKQLFYALMALALIGCVIFGVRMFTA